MARKFAQIRPEMWLDDGWRDLTAGAQHLYLMVLTDPDLSHCGVTDWRPQRLVPRAKEWSMKELYIAAQELSDKLFLVFDEDTEEVMVRSFLRHDGLLKQPRMAVSATIAFGKIGSNKIRAAVVWELGRLKKENPDLGAWNAAQMKTVLRQNSVNPRDMVTDLTVPLGIGLDLTLPIDLPIGLGVGYGETQTKAKGFSKGFDTPNTLHLTPAPLNKFNAVENLNTFPQPHPGGDSA